MSRLRNEIPMMMVSMVMVLLFIVYYYQEQGFASFYSASFCIALQSKLRSVKCQIY